ncbi:MAG: hypothetical protein RIG62_24815 [Cyclobacteriaceae bacterium]
MGILWSCGPSGVWWYGDIELGDEYYYMVEPAFNAIQTLKTDDDNRSNGYVIKNIESIGFNEDFILAVNKDSLHLQYWIIDKNRNSELYQEAKRNQLVHEEVIGPMDSLEFMDFKASQKIELKTKTYYREKLNYE